MERMDGLQFVSGWEVAASADAPLETRGGVRVDYAVDVLVFTTRYAVVVSVVDDLVVAVHCGDEPTPIGLLETGERP